MGDTVVAPGIVRNPERMGGVPTIAGTRMYAVTLLDYLAYGMSIDDYLEQFPPPPTRAESLRAIAYGAQLVRDFPRCFPTPVVQMLGRPAPRPHLTRRSIQRSAPGQEQRASRSQTRPW